MAFTNSSLLKKIIQLLLLILIFLGVFILFYGAALSMPYNSDHATILLEAQSIIHHNFLLQGWTLSTVSYYTTEIPLTVLAIRLFGYSENIIYIVTAFSYSLLALIILYISSITIENKFNPQNLLIAGCFSLFIISLMKYFTYFSPCHIVGFFYCFCSIIPFLKVERGSNILRGTIIFGFLLLLAFAGDTFALYAWGIPVGIILLVKIFTKEDKKKYISLLLGLLVPIILSKLFSFYITINHGFVLPGVKTNFVDYSNIINNVYLFIVGIFDLFSVKLFGQTVASFESLIGIIHLLGLITFILLVIYGIKNFKTKSTIEQIFLLVILLNLLEYLVGNLAVNRKTVRYLIPSLLFFIPLVPAYIRQNKILQNHLLQYSFCLLIGLSLIPGISFTQPNLPVSNLDSFLIQHHLENGYGPYWVSSVTTVHTNELVNIRPVIENGQYLKPYDWLSDRDWYQTAANFLVVDNAEQEVTSDMAINTFGKPVQIYLVDNYQVLVWDHNISPELLTQR